MKKLIVFSMVLLSLFYVGAAPQTSTKKTAKNVNNDPGIYDSEYVHDEKELF